MATMDQDYSDLAFQKLSQVLNFFLDMDERTKTSLTSALGVFLTLYSLHKIELKIKELFQFILTFKLMYIILIILVMSLLIYVCIKYDWYSVCFEYLSKNFELRQLFYGSIVFLLAVSIGNQFFSFKSDDVNLSLKNTSPIELENTLNNNLNFSDFNLVEFNKKFLKIISNITRRHLNNEKLNSAELSKNKSKNSIQIDIFNDSIRLFNFLDTFFKSNNFKKNQFFNHEIGPGVVEIKTAKFENLFDLWKFLIKICFFSVLNLVFIYVLIRALMWVLIENDSQKNFDEDNISSLELNFSPTSSIDRTESIQEPELDKTSETSKKKITYVKNHPFRTSPNRISKKGLLKKYLKASNSFDGCFDLEQYEEFNFSNDKRMSNSLISIVYADFTNTKQEIPNIEIVNDIPEDRIQDEFNIEFFINWLTSDNIGEIFNLEKDIDCDLALVLNETVQNMVISEVDAKYDDIYFKSVDTLPPKFTNIQTVVSDNENLTLKSNVEFKNIDVKAELKRSHRQIDFNVLTASGQAMIVLGQSINSAYVLDCSIDPQSELHIEIKKDQNIEQSLVQFLENVLKNSIKQFVLNLELNFQNKKLTGSTRMNMQHLSPQSNISSPNQTLSTSSSNIGQSPSSSNSSPEPTKTNSDSLNASQVRNNANEKRLLVKLIKANNLANCEEPYCVVELDYPMQKHLTDVHRDYSSINEQFLFDITPNSEELSIYVYDRAKDYGNDLIGEAVLPANDLCSGTSGKRVIQLHRFGSQKTGSLTVEFVFIEPINPRIELRNRSSIASRASRSPYDSVEKQIENKNSFSYKDDMLNEQKLLKTAIDNLSINSLTGPKQNFSPSGLNQNTNIQILNDPTSRHHYIQSNTQNHESQPDTENPISNTSTNGRVINRNYLQIQPSNIKSNTLQSSQLISSIYSDEAFKGVDPDDHKRTRSISRSVKNLFKPKSKKRDKSYDIQTGNQYDVHSVDGENLKKSKSIGGSLKKLFNIKKSSKKYEGSIHNETRPGSPNTISITVSRPSDSNFMGSSHASHLLTPVNSDTTQASFQTKHTNNYGNVTSQLDNSTKQNDESYERKEPLTFKRSLK